MASGEGTSQHEAWEKPLGPDSDWWQRYEAGVGTVTVAWRTANGIEGWYLSNATGAVQVFLDGQTKPERNPAPLATADAVLQVLADARESRAATPTAPTVGDEFHLHRASIRHSHAGGADPHAHQPLDDLSLWIQASWLLLGERDGWAADWTPSDPRDGWRPFEVPMVVDYPGDTEEWRRIRFVVPADRSVPPVGTPVSVPVDAGWLDLGIIAAGRVVDGGVELTLELHEDLAAAGGADTNESVA